MKTISIYRRDFKDPEDGDADFFGDICIQLGLAPDYDEALDIDEIELVVEQSTVTY